MLFSFEFQPLIWQTSQPLSCFQLHSVSAPLFLLCFFFIPFSLILSFGLSSILSSPPPTNHYSYWTSNRIHFLWRAGILLDLCLTAHKWAWPLVYRTPVLRFPTQPQVKCVWDLCHQMRAQLACLLSGTWTDCVSLLRCNFPAVWTLNLWYQLWPPVVEWMGGMKRIVGKTCKNKTFKLCTPTLYLHTLHFTVQIV